MLSVRQRLRQLVLFRAALCRKEPRSLVEGFQEATGQGKASCTATAWQCPGKEYHQRLSSLFERFQYFGSHGAAHAGFRPLFRHATGKRSMRNLRQVVCLNASLYATYGRCPWRHGEGGRNACQPFLPTTWNQMKYFTLYGGLIFQLLTQRVRYPYIR